MPLVITDAIVLHSLDYLETSRILRLATREAGVQSVLARSARTSKKRFGSALDLFAEGVAQIDIKPGRDLHTLSSFDVVRVRPALAADLGRFAAAAALSECAQRLITEEHAPAAFVILQEALDTLSVAENAGAIAAVVGALWRLMAELGIAPSLAHCASCHDPIGEPEGGGRSAFSHEAGGMLCQRCARLAPTARRLPPEARQALAHWVDGTAVELGSTAEGRAHQRLVREFLRQHLLDLATVRAWVSWERGDWCS